MTAADDVANASNADSHPSSSHVETAFCTTCRSPTPFDGRNAFLADVSGSDEDGVDDVNLDSVVAAAAADASLEFHAASTFCASDGHLDDGMRTESNSQTSSEEGGGGGGKCARIGFPAAQNEAALMLPTPLAPKETGEDTGEDGFMAPSYVAIKAMVNFVAAKSGNVLTFDFVGERPDFESADSSKECQVC